MKFLWRWLKRLVLGGVLLVVLLAAPVVYTEVACRGSGAAAPYDPIIADPEWQRAESRTLTTYPEWHIVHAYDDYAKVIATGAPHDFAYGQAVAGFWTALCPLAKASSEMGGFTTESKMTIYTIGVSFTVEFAAKALYEETLGRLAVIIRGEPRAVLDDLSARQAADYAVFLQQTPWYKWDFKADRTELASVQGESFRDTERRIALGLEFGAKAAYAGVIENAVAGVGADELRIRSVVTGLDSAALASVAGVDVIGELPAGVLIETDRYRVFTGILRDLAIKGAAFVEIAGNDEILFTITNETSEEDGAVYSFPRQGYGDWRHLIIVPVTALAENLRRFESQLEHVHDY